MRNIVFTGKAYEDFIDWSKENKILFQRLARLIEETSRNPFKGIGKPEPLKNELQGLWSRRIDDEHRLVYEVTENSINIISCKYHY